MKKFVKFRPPQFVVRLQRKAIVLPRGWMNCSATAAINWSMPQSVFRNLHTRKSIRCIHAHCTRLSVRKAIVCIGGVFYHMSNANVYGKNTIVQRLAKQCISICDAVLIVFLKKKTPFRFYFSTKHRPNRKSRFDRIRVHRN